MKLLDSRALEYVNRVLGISGGSGARVEVDDAVLQQVMDVSALVRRGRSIGASGGIFSTGIENTHNTGAASSRTGTINPYEPATAPASPYPFGAGPELDIWLLGFKAGNQSVPTGFEGASLAVQMISARGLNAAIPVTGTGAVVAASTNLFFEVAEWDALGAAFASGFVGQPLIDTNRNRPSMLLPMRIPRGATIAFTTRVSTADAGVYRCNLLLGVFPAGLGQDAIGTG